MRPSVYPDWLDDVLAKSPEKGEGGQAESLAEHTWAVLTRLSEFIRLRPHLHVQLGQPDLWHILFWAAFFHDFGKAAPDFQGVLRKDKQSKEQWGRNRHEVFSLAFLSWVANGLTDEQRRWVTAAVVSHHRDPGEIYDLYPPVDPDRRNNDTDGLARILTEIDEAVLFGLWRWVADCGWEWAKSLGLEKMGVGPLSFVDQVEAADLIHRRGEEQVRGALRVYSRMIRNLDGESDDLWVGLLTLRGYLINADHGGSAHVEPLPTAYFSAQDIYEKRGIQPEHLFRHQSLAGVTEGSALLTAPTGSGKTEAALLWTACQQVEGRQAPRLFYTLPYQASMNAMRLRLVEIFGEQKVSLQHGRGLLALYRQLMEKEDSNPGDAARNARWMRNLAELNHTPVRIFSPFQMLKGMYRLKGYEAQLTDYHNGLFVFDEIHAYEVKRLAMILRMIAYLRQHYHARFFVMSATFPSLIKGWLKDALDMPVEISAPPSVFAEFQRHQLHVLEGDLLSEEYLQHIKNEASGGKSVLIVCNTVDRAQQAYSVMKTLREGGIPVELLHGRFNMRDRTQKERFIREKASTRNLEKPPVVLVATQVVEVSLDIDFETIYTDPAPLEALVQRFGRINRGRHIKPYAPVFVFTRPDDGQKIYDQELISRTLDILRRENGHPIDEGAIESWLDEIYSGTVAERWQKEYQKAADEFEDVCVRTLKPFEADPGLEDAFYKAFDNVEVLPEILYDEYNVLNTDNPIMAGELVVPIRWGRYHELINKGQIIPGDKTLPPIVKAPYSSELGLTYDGIQPSEDGE